jgi:hypothetical protein
LPGPAPNRDHAVPFERVAGVRLWKNEEALWLSNIDTQHMTACVDRIFTNLFSARFTSAFEVMAQTARLSCVCSPRIAG